MKTRLIGEHRPQCVTDTITALEAEKVHWVNHCATAKKYEAAHFYSAQADKCDVTIHTLKNLFPGLQEWRTGDKDGN